MSNLKSKLCGTGLSLVLFATIPSFAQQTTAPPTTTTTAPSSTPSSTNDSQSIAPPASQSISKPELPESPSTVQQQQPPQPQQNSSAPASTQAPFQQPSGTAAAQQGRVSGTTLSEPAGVAIAPAKQRRTRSILIKMGFIAGAGIAIGTVAALSMASPSKPPGAP